MFRAVRLAMLGLVSVAIAHDAIFTAQYGFGAAFARAMQDGGHDGYWPVFSMVAVVAATVLGLRAAVRIGRLSVVDRSTRLVTAEPGSCQRGYRRELIGLWPPLLALVTVAFTVQENVEHLAGHGHVIGLGALTGPEYPLALPVLALVTLAAASVGALVRWRITVLTARLAGRPPVVRRRRLGARRPSPRWTDVAAIRAHAWFLVRLDAGRAPPLAA